MGVGVGWVSPGLACLFVCVCVRRIDVAAASVQIHLVYN